MRQILVPHIFCLLLISCTDTTPKGNKYYILLHVEQQEAMGPRYLPKTEIDSVIAISDSAAYVQGGLYLLAVEENFQRMKAEGLGVYKKVKGFTVTDTIGNDIKKKINPSVITRIGAFIKKRTAKEFAY